MPSLNSTIDIDVKKFFSWWLESLSFLVPEKIQRMVSNATGFIVIQPQNHQFHLRYQLDHHRESLGTIERNEAGTAQWKAISANDDRLAKAQVVICLSSHEAIQKELLLPLAAKENLAQVVAYELDKYTPFKAEQVYFAVKLLGNEADLLRVQLTLTTRESLDSLYEDVIALGLAPVRAMLGESMDAPNLLPDRLLPKTAGAPRLIYGSLISLTVLLLISALVLPLWFEYQTVNVLQDKISHIEKSAKQVKAMQVEIDAMTEETRKLIAEKTNAPDMIDILNTLSSLIKDDTTLSYLQYSDGHLQIQGESPVASTLIGVLEASDLFLNTRFVSPVTRDTMTKLERFQITVDVQMKTGVPNASQ